MRFRLLFFVVPIFVLSACSEYQKVLKSTDPELKYAKAKEYFEDEDYARSSTLLSELMPIYRGTARAEEATLLLAESYIGQKNYLMAGHYYGQFAKSFTTSSKLPDAYFNRAYCFYMGSPNPRLDQSETNQGINAFELFLELFPSSPKADEAQKYIAELEDKLVYKSYLNAKLYFDLGNYLGNNYQSAVIAAENSLKDYPDTKYREELSFLILKSKYIQAENSVREKQEERYRETIDEYYSFVNDFPQSKFGKEADKMLTDSQKAIKSN